MTLTTSDLLIISAALNHALRGDCFLGSADFEAAVATENVVKTMLEALDKPSAAPSAAVAHTHYAFDPTGLYIRSPGKFQGEPRWAPHFYEAWLNGEANNSGSEDDNTVTIYINAEDQKLYPELEGFYEVHLSVDDQGFVYCEAIREPVPEAQS